MRNYSENDKNIWISDLAHKNYKVTIGNGENVQIFLNSAIKEESIEITEVLEDSAQLTFAGCKAKKLSVSIEYFDANIIGQDIKVEANAELFGDTTANITLFSGKISEVKQSTNDDIVSTIIAYDAMATVNDMDVADWYNTLMFPMTMQAFADSLAAMLDNVGISLNAGSLPLGDISIDKTVLPQELALKDVLIAITTLNGVYCYCDIDNVIRFKTLTKDIPVASFDTGDYKSIDYKKYQVATIDKVVLREDADDIGAIYGAGTNAYIVEGNFLLYGKNVAQMDSIAQRVYAIVNGYVYTPAKMVCTAMPWFEIGDYIEIKTDRNTIRSYVLERSFKGIQNALDTYTSKQDATRTSQINSINTSILQLRGKANKLTRDIEHMSSTIYNEDGSSKIEQTAQAIELQIEAIYKQIDGTITTYYTDYVPTLLNYPAWDFTYNIPCNNTVKTTDDLRFIYTDEYYKRNLRALVFNSDNEMSYRFKQSEDGTFFWEEIADTEYATIMRRVTALEVKDGEITASVEQVTQTVGGLETTTEKLSSSVSQTASEIKSEVTRAQKAEETLSSSITQTAEGIKSRVEKGTISSEISQEAGRITISSDRLVINSTNFSLSANGTIKATNAELSGKITATSGTIGGLTIGTDSLKYTGGAYGASVEITPAASNILKAGTPAHDGLPARYAVIDRVGGISAYQLSVDNSITCNSLTSRTSIECQSLKLQFRTLTIGGGLSTKWDANLGAWVLCSTSAVVNGNLVTAY